MIDCLAIILIAFSFRLHIVPSGIFVALALRFDVSRGKEPQYFKSAFLGYTAGLALTIIVMNWFQAAQVTDLHFHFFFLICTRQGQGDIISVNMRFSRYSCFSLRFCILYLV